MNTSIHNHIICSCYLLLLTPTAWPATKPMAILVMMIVMIRASIVLLLLLMINRNKSLIGTSEYYSSYILGYAS